MLVCVCIRCSVVLLLCVFLFFLCLCFLLIVVSNEIGGHPGIEPAGYHPVAPCDSSHCEPAFGKLVIFRTDQESKARRF